MWGWGLFPKTLPTLSVPGALEGQSELAAGMTKQTEESPGSAQSQLPVRDSGLVISRWVVKSGANVASMPLTTPGTCHLPSLGFSFPICQ